MMLERTRVSSLLFVLPVVAAGCTSTVDDTEASSADEIVAATSAYTQTARTTPLDACKLVSEWSSEVTWIRKLACGEMGGYTLFVEDASDLLEPNTHHPWITIGTPNGNAWVNLFGQTDVEPPPPHLPWPTAGGYFAKVAEWRGAGVQMATPDDPFSGKVRPTALILRFHPISAASPYGSFAGDNSLAIVKLTSDNACLQSVVSGAIANHNQIARDIADSQAFRDFQCDGRTPEPIPPTGCGALQPGTGLSRNQMVSSCTGSHSLVMQNDGNLVLYNNQTKRATWSSHTENTSSVVALMRRDGMFAVYGYWLDASFTTPTAGKNDATLAVQDDGNLVLYAKDGAVLWASNTAGQ